MASNAGECQGARVFPGPPIPDPFLVPSNP